MESQKEPKHLTNTLYFELRDMDMALYIKAIQHWATVEHCWLLRSTPKTNCEELKGKIERKAGFEVGARWKAIAMFDRNIGKRITRTDKGIPKAVHLETAKEHETKFKQVLEEYFSSRTKKFLLYNEMRKMPLLRNVSTNHQSKAEMLAVANQQLKYNLDVDHMETDSILDLNMTLKVPKASPLNIPVREFLQRVAYMIHGHKFQPFLQINKK